MSGPDDPLAVALGCLTAPGAGLLLDLDGTLVLSEPVHQEAYRAYFRERGWVVPDDVVEGFSGRRGREVFATTPGPWRGEVPTELAGAVLATLARLLAAGARPDPVPGAAAALAHAARAGLPTAVVTSAGRAWTRRVLRELAPDADDDAVRLVTAEDCDRGKPDPEPYARGAAALGLDPAGLVAFEDTPAGIASAQAAGAGAVVGVTTSRTADTLLGAGADACAPDLTALAAALAGLPGPHAGGPGG